MVAKKKAAPVERRKVEKRAAVVVVRHNGREVLNADLMGLVNAATGGEDLAGAVVEVIITGEGSRASHRLAVPSEYKLKLPGLASIGAE